MNTKGVVEGWVLWAGRWLGERFCGSKPIFDKCDRFPDFSGFGVRDASGGVIETSKSDGKRNPPGFESAGRARATGGGIRRPSYLQVDTREQGFWIPRRLCGWVERVKIGEGPALAARPSDTIAEKPDAGTCA